MKKKDFSELKTKTAKELSDRLQTLRTEIVNANLELKMGRVKNVHEVIAKRRDAARILTLLKLKSFESTKQKKTQAEENIK